MPLSWNFDQLARNGEIKKKNFTAVFEYRTNSRRGWVRLAQSLPWPCLVYSWWGANRPNNNVPYFLKKSSIYFFQFFELTALYSKYHSLYWCSLAHPWGHQCRHCLCPERIGDRFGRRSSIATSLLRNQLHPGEIKLVAQLKEGRPLQLDLR